VLIVAVGCGLDWYLFVFFQKQTKEIKEKQTSVMAELAKVEPAVQDAKMGKSSRAQHKQILEPGEVEKMMYHQILKSNVKELC